MEDKLFEFSTALRKTKTVERLRGSQENTKNTFGVFLFSSNGLEKNKLIYSGEKENRRIRSEEGIHVTDSKSPSE